VANGEMILNKQGKIVSECWHDLSNHFPKIELDAFAIMPNHLHGIIVLHCRGLINQTPTNQIPPDHIPASRASKNWILMQAPEQTVGKIVRYFKAKASKLQHDYGFHDFQWQRNYYEHIIRTENKFLRIRDYIMNNAVQWETDIENPHCINKTSVKDYYKRIMKNKRDV
jgi:REP element-mobilizing transposase RayT